VAGDRTRRKPKKDPSSNTRSRRGDAPARSTDEAEARAVRAALGRGASATELSTALAELDESTRARVVGQLQHAQGNSAVGGVIAAGRTGGGGGGIVQREVLSGAVSEQIGDAQERPYTVVANDLAGVARAIRARTEAGKVSWSPTIDWAADGGQVNRVDLTVDITLDMPEWSPPESVGPLARAEWTRWREALLRHEQGHIQLVHRYFDGLAARMIGQPPRTVRRLFETAKRMLARASRDYDAATDHGRKTGTIIDVHVREATGG